ncbi:hypothetical protein BsWGS_26040 [Bradybaena similaris]
MNEHDTIDQGVVPENPDDNVMDAPDSSSKSFLFGKEQEADVSLQELIQKAKLYTPGTPINGITYRKICNIYYRFIPRGQEVHKQILLPRAYRTQVLKFAHDIPCSAHMGRTKTLQRITQQFFWPGITRDIGLYCRTCKQCQKMSRRGQDRAAPVQEHFVTGVPFSRLALDIIGPLTPTQSGNRYILTVVDFCSRYPEAFALQSITSQDICDALMTFFSRFGFPKSILSDNGPQFVSKLTAEVAKLLGIQHKFCSFYHACANGLCEKINGVLKNLLAKVTYDHPDQWDKFLQPVLFAIREMPNESIGLSPFEILFGANPRGIMDLYKDMITGKEMSDETKDAYSYTFELRQKIVNAGRYAKEALTTAGQRQRFYANQKSKLRTLASGDKVLVLLPEKSNRLLVSWKGPYNVIEPVTPVDYLVDINNKPKVFHINMLRQYLERPEFLQQIIEDNIPDNIQQANSVIILPESSSPDDLPTLIEFPSVLQKQTFRDVNIAHNLNQDEYGKLADLVSQFGKVFSDIPGKTTAIEHKITLTTDVPIRVKPYPIPFHFRDQVNEEIQELLKLGIIEETDSQYGAPIVLAKKKDKSIRICVDYRKLNAVTIPDHIPMQDPQALLTQIADSKYFSKIDLTKGYHQIPVSNDSKHLTAFQTSENTYLFNYLPFGLSNAPATFVRLMRKIFKNVPSVVHYFDDILVHTTTFREHLIALERVLQILQDNHLTAKPSKAELGKTSLVFLGHTIEEGCIGPDMNNITKILQLKPPQTKKQVRQIIGLVNYYHDFVSNYSQLMTPLTDLLKGGPTQRRIKWTPECQTALNTIQDIFRTKPILLTPNIKKAFVLATDCSSTGCGFCLKQYKGEKLHPVLYGSKKLTPAEQKFSCIERELYSMCLGVLKFKKYLLGAPFTIEIDHKPLQYLQTKQITNPKLLRFLLNIQEFDFKITSVPGSENIFADILSRY